MLNKLNIVRDCWWVMTSGDSYMVDENATLASQSHALYTSFNSNDSQFVRASNSGELTYYGRLETTNINTTALYAILRAECQPPGSAILKINNYDMAIVNISGGINNYETTVVLSKQQIQRIHYGRIDKNYDYFDIQLDSHKSNAATFRAPNLWLDAGSGVYSDLIGTVINNGEQVEAWHSRGSGQEQFTKDQSPGYSDGLNRCPYYRSSVINGQPGLQFFSASGMFLWCETSTPLTSTSGTFYSVIVPHSHIIGFTTYAQNEAVGSGESYAVHSITYEDGISSPPYGSGLKPYFSVRKNATLPNRDSEMLYGVLSSGTPILLGWTQNHGKFDQTFKFWELNGSGAQNLADTTNPHYWGDAAGAHNASIGLNYNGANPGLPDQDNPSLYYVLEIMGWETPLSSGELVAVNRYIYDKYAVGDSYIPTQIKLYDFNIYYSGDTTWDNHKTGLPNAASETYYPTSIYYPPGTSWTGSIDAINDGIYSSGVDDLYLEYNGTSRNITQRFLGRRPFISRRTTYGAAMPSGHLGIKFTDWTSNIDVSWIYDEHGAAHGSGVGIDQYSFKNVTPSGLAGYSLEASGSIGHAAMGRVLNMGSGDYSMECWIRTNATGILTPCIGATRNVGGSESRWYLGIQSTNVGRVYLNMSASTYQFNGTTNICDGEWHHIASTAKRDGNLTLYVDGTSEGTPVSIAASEGYDAQMPAGTQFMLGWGQAYADRNVDIALPRVYRAALTQEEVQLRASGLPITQPPVAEWTFNRQITEGLDSFTKITRARMNLRMSLPIASGYNNQDTLEINGYNARYKNRDHREELEYVNASQASRSSAYGYFLYGAGPIIQQSGFRNYSVELNFINPDNPSGDFQSTRHANADMLANMSFQLIGIPSGTRISAAELQVEYLPDSFTPLYTIGADNVYRCASSGEVDAGTSDSWSSGHGGWHHQGWRLIGPTVIEEDVFTNFYTFSEGRGNTRTYPETTKAYYFPDGDKDETVYADYLYYCPYGTEGDEGDVISLLKDPQRREYYRNPISASDLTPVYEQSLRDISSFKPHYYRHMIYHGASLEYVDVEPGDGDATALAEADLCQIYFEDRIGLLEDFTLYFAIYRDYGFQSYGRFFHRGLTEADGIGDYEIYGDLEPNLVRFTVQGANGTDNRVEVEINQYTKEPILIWFSCGYDEDLGVTNMKLNVHQDTKNYFSQDWLHSEATFTGRRKQYSPNIVVVNEPPNDPYTTSLGGPRTVIGTLEILNVYEQMSRRLYLHHASPVEFGYKAGEAIELDYTTSTTATQALYDTSQSKDKRFLATRVCNSHYMQHNPSGVRWVVPYGSGVAEWRTRYNVFESWSPASVRYVYNPVSTAGTNHVVHPSAVWVELDIAHNTDHPSGLTIDVDVEFDSGTSDNWKVAHTTLEGIPSGGAVWLQYAPIRYTTYTSKHINMDDDPIRWTDLENINITVTTKYPGYGEESYYGSLEIRSLQVYLDSYCIAATGLADLDLYTHGTATIVDEPRLDLYTLGSITVPADADDGALDLYIYGIPYYASGDVTLYTHGKWPPIVLPNDDSALRLYIEGLDPPEVSGDFPLYVWGTANPGIRNDTTLFTHSTLDPRWRLPLFIEAGVASGEASMNLYINNYPWINPWNTMSLYTVGPSGIKGISGNYVLQLPDGSILDIGFNSTGPLALSEDPNVCLLYIRGAGTNDGWYPNNADMPLYIDRDSEATAARLSLYMSQNRVSATLNQYVYGHGVPASSVPLYIHGSGVPITDQLEFYTHGF